MARCAMYERFMAELRAITALPAFSAGSGPALTATPLVTSRSMASSASLPTQSSRYAGTRASPSPRW